MFGEGKLKSKFLHKPEINGEIELYCWHCRGLLYFGDRKSYDNKRVCCKRVYLILSLCSLRNFKYFNLSLVNPKYISKILI